MVVGVGGDDAAELIQGAADYEETDEADASEETRLLYQQAVNLIRNEFSEKHVQAFLLTVFQQKSAADAAQELQITPNTVYLARSRILRRLREEFAELLDENAERRAV